MKNWLKENKYIVIFIVILGLIFYWYDLRPKFIRKECIDKASKGLVIIDEKKEFNEYKFRAERGALSKEDIDLLYEICLKNKGLEK